MVDGEAECPTCAGLELVTYVVGTAPRTGPFCMRCKRQLRAVEVDPRGYRGEPVWQPETK